MAALLRSGVGDWAQLEQVRTNGLLELLIRGRSAELEKTFRKRPTVRVQLLKTRKIQMFYSKRELEQNPDEVIL
jgi:hypothetical protein